MRRLPFHLTVSVASFVGLSQLALADGMVTKTSGPAPAVLTTSEWVGPYAGLETGGGFGLGDVSHIGLPTTGALASVANGNYGLDHDLNGWLAGGQIGYNWQAQTVVIGVEADLNWTDIDGSGHVSGTAVAQQGGGAAAPGNFVTASENINLFGTVRGRLGMLASPKLLLYGTGGLAFARIQYTGQFHYTTPQDYIASDTATRYGWTIGGGAEYQIHRGWTVKAEYLYYDLGSHSIVSGFGVPNNPPFQSQFDFDTHGSIVRVGLNFKFGDREPMASAPLK